jgi:hypothetical protein
VTSLSEEDIQNSQIENIMSSWILSFNKQFSELFENENDPPRFMELRPNCFYL